MVFLKLYQTIYGFFTRLQQHTFRYFLQKGFLPLKTHKLLPRECIMHPELSHIDEMQIITFLLPLHQICLKLVHGAREEITKKQIAPLLSSIIHICELSFNITIQRLQLSWGSNFINYQWQITDLSMDSQGAHKRPFVELRDNKGKPSFQIHKLSLSINKWAIHAISGIYDLLIAAPSCL